MRSDGELELPIAGMIYSHAASEALPVLCKVLPYLCRIPFRNLVVFVDHL